jgi:hypothetical protein
MVIVEELLETHGDAIIFLKCVSLELTLANRPDHAQLPKDDPKPSVHCLTFPCNMDTVKIIGRPKAPPVCP